MEGVPNLAGIPPGGEFLGLRGNGPQIDRLNTCEVLILLADFAEVITIIVQPSQNISSVMTRNSTSHIKRDMAHFITHNMMLHCQMSHIICNVSFESVLEWGNNILTYGDNGSKKVATASRYLLTMVVF